MTRTQFIRCHGRDTLERLESAGLINEKTTKAELDVIDEDIVRIVQMVIPKEFVVCSVLDAIEIIEREHPDHPECIWLTDGHGEDHRKPGKKRNGKK